jgi:hypothetical protein
MPYIFHEMLMSQLDVPEEVKEMRKCKDTLEEIEKTFGAGFMNLFPKEVLVRDWPSWKSLSEIDLERASYLLSTSELLEEMLDGSRSKITNNIDAEFSEAFGFEALVPIRYVTERKKNYLEGEPG